MLVPVDYKFLPSLIMVIVSSLLLLSFLTINVGVNASASTSTNSNKGNNSSEKITSVYEINTRPNPTNVSATVQQRYGYPLKNITELYSSCPKEVVIFVHGWNDTPYDATERLDRVKMSLENNKYTNISLVGFSWPSNTDWPDAKHLAKDNGQKLAEFIIKYMDTCNSNDKQPQQQDKAKVRLIGHSLGARVILSSLESLFKNTAWNNNNFKISSIHLMGAPVDDDEVSKNPSDVGSSDIKLAYGKAIEKEVLNFYNLFNPNDDMLQPGDILYSKYSPFNSAENQPVVYPYVEQDLALGQNGSQSNISKPPNYVNVNVENEIRFINDSDGDGRCDFTFPPTYICNIKAVGDNHGGYIGFRSTNNDKPFLDDGAINVVVEQWREHGQ
jgi:Alpha/beta hydrolase of unknown function (DUF900)